MHWLILLLIVYYKPISNKLLRQYSRGTRKAGREASWLKQVRKVKRVGESEKWVTRPRGEE